MEAENMVFTGSFSQTGTLHLLVHQRVPASHRQLQLGHTHRQLQVRRLRVRRSLRWLITLFHRASHVA
jgi:hypothetical protein